MTLISIITLLVSIALLIALFLHKKDLNNDFEFFCLYGEHLYDPQGVEERERILLIIAIGNTAIALFNLLYFFFK